MNIKEESLKKAIEASHCHDLPKQMSSDESRFWIEAIVLVRKQNLTTSYALAKHRGDGSILITADYGMISPIAGTVSIHPYLYLDDKFIPEGTTQEVKYKLLNFYSDVEKREKIENASPEDLEFMKIEYAIELQASSSTTADLQDEIIQAAEEVEQQMQQQSDEEETIKVAAKPNRRKYKRRHE